MPPTPKPPPPTPPPGNPLSLLVPRRFGSVQSQVKLGPICGRASARIWIMTPLVRLISSNALRTLGFCCSAVTTACSSVKTGAPLSDQPRSLSPSTAARNPIGVAEGDGETLGDAPKLEGTDAVATSLGVPDGEGVGVD